MSRNVPATSTFSYLGLGLSAAGRKGPSPVVGTPPVNTVAPALTFGDPYPNRVVVSSTGTWLNSPSGYTYAWLRNDVVISGALANNYILSVDDVGANIKCRVSATNADGSNSATSNALSRVLWSPEVIKAKIGRWIDCDYDPATTEVGGLVTQLSDLSGNNGHLIQPTGASQAARAVSAALNNRKVLKLIGPATTGPFMYAENAAALLRSYLMSISVFQMTMSSGQTSPKLSATTVLGTADATTNSIVLIGQAGTSNLLRTSVYDNVAAGLKNAQVSYNGLSPCVYQGGYNSINVIASLNGNTQVVTALAGATTSKSERVALGANMNAGAYGGVRAIADYGEAITLVDPASTQDDYDRTVGYLAWKWGPVTLVGLLPAGHPFKAAAP